MLFICHPMRSLCFFPHELDDNLFPPGSDPPRDLKPFSWRLTAAYLHAVCSMLSLREWQSQIYPLVNPAFWQATVIPPCLHCDWHAGSSVSQQINQLTITAAEPLNKIKASESRVHTATEEFTLSPEGLKSRHSSCCCCRLVDRHLGTVTNVLTKVSGNVI